MKLKYIHLPKCGGTAVKSYFTDFNIELDVIPHRDLTQNFANGHYQKEPDAVYFTTVRNPFDYWVSSYFYSRKLSKRNHWFWFGQHKRTDIENHFTLFVNRIYNRIQNGKHETESLKFHYDLYCYDEAGVFVPDHVIKLEEIDDLQIVINQTDIEPEQKPTEYFKLEFDTHGHHINHTNHKHYSRYYTPETVYKVWEMEKELISKYNYEFRKHK